MPSVQSSSRSADCDGQQEVVGRLEPRAAERAGDHVPLGVLGGLGLGDLAGVDQLLDDAVVGADLLEDAVGDR